MPRTPSIVHTPPATGGPKPLRPPSERDLRIYKFVAISRVPQFEVAANFEIEPSRVSQIVKRVRKWLAAGGAPTDPDLREQVARKRMSLATHKLRLERAIELTTFAMQVNESHNTTTRRRYRGFDELWREETIREVPQVNLRAIGLMLRAAESLRKLEDETHGKHQPEPLGDQQLLPAVFELLCRWRQRAEAEGRIAAGSEVRALVAGALSGLLGANVAEGLEVALQCSPPSAKEALNMSADREERDSASIGEAKSCESEPGLAPAEFSKV